MLFNIGDRVIYHRSPHSSEVGYISSITTINEISDRSYEAYRKSNQMDDLFSTHTQHITYSVLFFTFEVDDAGKQSVYTINDISPTQLELSSDNITVKEKSNMTTQNFTLGIKDVNGKFIHVNDVLKFENEEIVPVLDDGSGPTQHFTEFLFVTVIGDEIIFEKLSDYDVIDEQNYKAHLLTNVRISEKSLKLWLNYQQVLYSYYPAEEFEIIGKYNPFTNEITLLN